MLSTFFAPAERMPAGDIQRCADLIQADSMMALLLDRHPTPTLFITGTRQIVYGNHAFRSLAPNDWNSLLGLRLGEALGCDQVASAPSGCGTGEACRQCGAARAIADSLQNKRFCQDECLFSSEHRGLMADFRISAYPIRANGLELIAIAVEDVSAEKRRSALERTFFHDLLNTASGLQGLAELVTCGELSAEEGREFSLQIRELAEDLIEEIRHQRRFLLAERGELEIERTCVNVQQFLQGVVRTHQNSPAACDRLLLLTGAPSVNVSTDAVLLKRVIGNLVKNALEATSPGGTVSLWCDIVGSNLQFTVHNEGVIPKSAQHQIFHRSFSTKGSPGRGIGTYSVKLFGEKYLGGRVRFTTGEAEGTRFVFTLPLA